MAQVNMTFENCTFEHQVKVNLLVPKKRKVLSSTQWEEPEMPSIPVLVNKKTIKEHTKLCVFQAEKKKEVKK